MSYDPRAYGARCDECPLGPQGFLYRGQFRPVPPEFHRRPDGAPRDAAIAVGEQPASMETERGFPFAGDSGVTWNDGLRAIGLTREDVAITNIVACQPPFPPRGAWEVMAAAIKAENERRAEAGLPPVPHPAECCRPRLDFELGLVPNWLLLGGSAAKAILRTTSGILAISGEPQEVALPGAAAHGGGPRAKVVPTMHPSFINSARGWYSTWIADLARAWRFFHDRMNWLEVATLWQPSAAELAAWFAASSEVWYEVDTETDGLEPLRCKLRCMAICRRAPAGTTVPCEVCGTQQRPFGPAGLAEPRRHYGDRSLAAWRAIRDAEGRCPVCRGRGVRDADKEAVLLLFHSDDGVTFHYSSDEYARVAQIVAERFDAPSLMWSGHNSIVYDEPILARYFGPRVTGRPGRPRHHLDKLYLARAEAPDVSKALGVVGRRHTDVRAWKADNEGVKIAWGAKDDWHRGSYCATDVAVGVAALPTLWANAEKRGYMRDIRADIRPASWPAGLPFRLLEVDNRHVAPMCQGLHRIGMHVNQARREQHAEKLRGEIRKWHQLAAEAMTELGGGPHADPDDANHLRDLLYERLKWRPAEAPDHRPSVTWQLLDRNVGVDPRLSPEQRADARAIAAYRRERAKPEGAVLRDAAVAAMQRLGYRAAVNPGSDAQIRELLYDRLGWEPVARSDKTNEPSVGRSVLIEHIVDDSLPQRQRDLLDYVRRYRTVRKALSSFVDVVNYEDVRIGGTEDSPKYGKVWRSDDRSHASWAGHVTPIGRLACSDENQQNRPGKYRDIYDCASGHVLIACDFDQMHLRIIANVWRVQRLLRAFAEDLDPHCMLAYDFFGQRFAQADGWSKGFGFESARKPSKASDASGMRDIAKIIRYQGAYADVPEGIWATVRRTLNKNGDLVYARFPLAEVERLHRAWMRAEPEWKREWERSARQYVANGGWIEECIMGRRSGDLEGGKVQATCNFEILACEPSLMRLAEIEVLNAFPWDHDGPGTGLVNHCHDSLMVETAGRAWYGACPPKGAAQGYDGTYWSVQRKPGSNGQDDVGKALFWDAATERKRRTMEEAMTVRIPGWPVVLTTEAKVGLNWLEVS